MLLCWLIDIFLNFIETRFKEDKINPLHFVFSPGYTWDAGWKYTKNKLENIQEADLLLIFENAIRDGISASKGKRYVGPVNDTKMLDIDSNNPYGLRMSKSSPYTYIRNDETIGLEKILSTADNADTGYVLEVDLKHTDKARKVS